MLVAERREGMFGTSEAFRDRKVSLKDISY